MDRRLGRRAHVDDAALAGDHEQPPGEAFLAQPAGQVAEIAAHQRLQRGVDAGRRGPAIFPHDRVEAMRQRHRHAGQVPGEQLADLVLMRRVGDRPQQADADRRHLRRRQPLDDPEQRRLVERPHDLAAGADPLQHLEGQRAGHVGPGKGLAVVVGIEPSALAQQQDVAMALGGQEGGARRGAGEHRVDGAGGRMDETADAGQIVAARPAGRGRGERDRRQHAFDRVVGRGRRLVEADPSLGRRYEIGEGAADVAGEADHRPIIAAPPRRGQGPFERGFPPPCALSLGEAWPGRRGRWRSAFGTRQLRFGEQDS